MSTTTTLQLVKPAEVEIQEGHNPRGKINEKSDSFKTLVSSIKDLGVLQPLLVAPRTNGHWPLVDGERRLRAARKAKVTEIPVYAVSNLDEFFAAIVANMEREDLTPMEEAWAIARMQNPGDGKKGLTQAQIAKRLGRSERWVRGRLDLLKLPAEAHAAVDAGEIGTEAAQKLAQISKQAPRLAEAMAKAVADPKTNWGSDSLLDDYSLTRLAESVAKSAGYMALSGYGGQRISELPVDKQTKAELTEKAKPLQEYERRVSFDSSHDVAAMKKQGIVVELVSGYGGKSRLVDAEKGRDWIAKTAVERLEAAVKDRAKRDKHLEAEHAQSAEDRKKFEEREQRKRAKEREQKQQVNLKLGEGLEKLARPKVTAELARLFVTMALNAFADNAGAGDLAGTLALTRSDRHAVVEGKGGLRIEVDRLAALNALVDEFESARAPEAVFGVGLQLLAAAHFAETDVDPKNHYWTSLPDGLWADDVEGYPRERVFDDAADQLERLALDAGILPDSLRKGVEEELERKAKQRAAEEVERKREEDGCEIRVLVELDRLGGKDGKEADQLTVFGACEDSKGGSQPHHQPFHHIAVEGALERLVASRQISRIETDDQVPAYKLNPSGRARIEGGAPAK